MAWSIAQPHHKEQTGTWSSACSVSSPPPLDHRPQHHEYAPFSYFNNDWSGKGQQQQQAQQGSCKSGGELPPHHHHQQPSTLEQLAPASTVLPVLITLLSVVWATLRFGLLDGRRPSSSPLTQGASTLDTSSPCRYRATAATRSATANQLIKALSQDLSAWIGSQWRRKSASDDNCSARSGSRLFVGPERAGTASTRTAGTTPPTIASQDGLKNSFSRQGDHHLNTLSPSSPQQLPLKGDVQEMRESPAAVLQHAESEHQQRQQPPSRPPLPNSTPSSSSSQLDLPPARMLGEQDARVLLENSRSWDHVLIGEGIETLEPATQLARQYPSRTILILAHRCQLDQRPFPRVTAWSRSALTAYVDRIWIGEALPDMDSTLVAALQDSRLQSAASSTTAPPSSGITTSASPTKHQLTQKEVDALPKNIYIGAGLIPKSLLLAAPNSGTLRPTMPSRTIGVEFVARSHTGVFELGVKESVIFINQQHDLLRRFNQWRVQLAKSIHPETPPPSSSSPASSSSKTEQTILGNTEELELADTSSSQTHSMQLTVRMEFRRMHLPRSYSPLIQKLGDLCFQSSSASSPTPSTSLRNRAYVPVEPVILYRSGVNVVRPGEQRQQQQQHDQRSAQKNDQYQLWIAAECDSLELTSPIRLSVKVLTPPSENEVFGNVGAIQQGEAIMMEGLCMARRMADKAGWTCVEEDDSNMVEWVRDQMDIQWVTNPFSTGSSVAMTGGLRHDPRWVLQHRTSMLGLQLISRYSSQSQMADRSGGRRSRTPVLSPYASRANSFVSKPRQSHLRDHNRNSTLDRLQMVADKLETSSSTKPAVVAANSNVQKQPSPPHAAVSIPELTEPSASATERTTRRSLVTSFGGFSSVRSNREGGAPHHSPDLAPSQTTMDHLSMALGGDRCGQSNVLSASPPLVATATTSSSNSPTLQQPSAIIPNMMKTTSSRSNSEGERTLTNADSFSGHSSSPPLPKAISRFSIKAYRMERDITGQTGLGVEWDIGIGGVGGGGGGLGIVSGSTDSGIVEGEGGSGGLLASKLGGSSPSRVKSLSPGLIQTDVFGPVNPLDGLSHSGGLSGTGLKDRHTPLSSGGEPPARSLFPGISSVNRVGSNGCVANIGSSNGESLGGGSGTPSSSFRTNSNSSHRNSFVAVSAGSLASIIPASSPLDEVPDFLGGHDHMFGSKTSPVIRPSFTTFAASPLPSQEVVSTAIMDPREKHAALAAALGVKPYTSTSNSNRATSPSRPTIERRTSNSASSVVTHDQVAPLPTLTNHGNFTSFRRSSSSNGSGVGGSRSNSISGGSVKVVHFTEGQDMQLNSSPPTGKRRRSSTRVSIVAAEESPTQLTPPATLG